MIALISFVIFMVLIFIIYLIWYQKNYITQESTTTYDKGWDRCYNCKKAESTMLYSHNIFGIRIYKCLQCSKKIKIIKK